MRFVMKEKFWSLGDDFIIRDETGADAYFVDGKVFSWGDDLSFQDMDGTELLRIDQKLLSWGPTYEIQAGGKVLAVVKKKLFTFFNAKFFVDVPGPDDLEATGSFLEHEYQFERHGEVVAQVSKRWFTWNDTYGIDIPRDDDVLLVLATAVVIDLVCHGDDNSGISIGLNN